MELKAFLKSHIKPGAEFPAGLISIDIVGHSALIGTDREKSETKSELENIIRSELLEETAALMSWEGDGGIVLFDISKGCDRMVLYADKIKHLLPVLNHSRSFLNKLPNQQDLMLRIVCHAGNLINQDGVAGKITGDALNLLAKREREIGWPGHVVLTMEVYRRLPIDFQERCITIDDHQDFGKTFLLDGNSTRINIQLNNRRSTSLKEWIATNQINHKFDTLLYFAYTNELLYDFLTYELSGLDIKIIIRNWVTEYQDETKYNKQLSPSELINRRWFKSEVIRLRAKEVIENARGAKKQIDLRFYSDPPLFNGAILIGKNIAPRAYIGFSKWEEKPETGGSPYKLEEWPAFELDGRDKKQLVSIDYFISRFTEIWSRGLDYEQVSQLEESEKLRDPMTASKIWKLDKQPYLIVYPCRRTPNRAFPVVAYEDLMAAQMLEGFLQNYGIAVKHLSIQLPDQLTGDWFPADAESEINGWKGHIIFICTKALPPSVTETLSAQGFPYQIHGVGTNSPYLQHKTKKELLLRSPMDQQIPEARDYSLIARFHRERESEVAYIAAGIRAMGTWGAAMYLTSRRDLISLSHLVSEEQFVAIVETLFNPNAFRPDHQSLFLAPEVFN